MELENYNDERLSAPPRKIMVVQGKYRTRQYEHSTPDTAGVRRIIQP